MEPAFEPDAERPLGAFGSNVDGTRRVLEFARSHGTRRSCFTSWALSMASSPLK